MAKRKSSKKKKQEKKQDITLIIVIILSILLTGLIYTQSGTIGIALSDFFGGMIGVLKYVLPLGAFAVAIKMACVDDDGYISSKIGQYVLLLIFIAVILSVYQIYNGEINIEQNISEVVKDAYQLGENNIGGGALGTIAAVPLFKLFGKIGTIIISVGAAVILFATTFGIDVAEIIRSIIQSGVENSKTKRELKMEEKEARHQEKLEKMAMMKEQGTTEKLSKKEIKAKLREENRKAYLENTEEDSEGQIKINGEPVEINDPNDANKYNIGMVHQHFKLVHNFTVLENIILGIEETKHTFIQKGAARKKVIELSQKYKLNVDPDALISDITVGMQQRVEILKMLFRDNNVLIFDEPTAVLTPQEIDELMIIMKDLAKEGKSIIFITHKLNEIKAVANRCTILRKGKYIGTVDVASTSAEKLSELMVGRKVNFIVEKDEPQIGDTVLEVRDLCYKPAHSSKNVLNNVSFNVRRGEIVCIAGIDGNGQTELVYALSGLIKHNSGQILLNGEDLSHESIRSRSLKGMAHIPEDRHKHGLVLDYNLAENFILKSYFDPKYQNKGFIKFDKMYETANKLIEQYDVRSGEGAKSITRGMSGGNQQKAIIAREVESNSDLLIAVQPTRGLDVGAIEFIHKQLVKQRDENKAVLLVSLELDEVMNVSDRILVMYEGEIVANLDPKQIDEKELGLYMSGSKRGEGYEK